MRRSAANGGGVTVDIKEQVEKLLGTITKDSALKDRFLKDPVATVKELVGDKVPTDAIENIVAGVKAKLTGDQLKDAVSGLGKLFGK